MIAKKLCVMARDGGGGGETRQRMRNKIQTYSGQLNENKIWVKCVERKNEHEHHRLLLIIERTHARTHIYTYACVQGLSMWGHIFGVSHTKIVHSLFRFKRMRLSSFIFVSAYIEDKHVCVCVGCDSYLVDDAVHHCHLVNGLHLCFFFDFCVAFRSDRGKRCKEREREGEIGWGLEKSRKKIISVNYSWLMRLMKSNLLAVNDGTRHSM